MRIAVYRKAHFNAAHRMHVKNWSDEQNEEVFGLCNSPNFHGHNYELIVKVVGEVDPVTGYLIDMKVLKDIIKEEIEDRFDHKNLNLDTPFFNDQTASSENFCYLIWQLLSERLGSHLEVTVRLYETPRNFVEFPA